MKLGFFRANSTASDHLLVIIDRSLVEIAHCNPKQRADIPRIMDLQPSTDELYPIAVLIDELKVGPDLAKAMGNLYGAYVTDAGRSTTMFFSA